MRKPKSQKRDKGDKHQRYARSYLPNSFKYIPDEHENDVETENT